MLQHEPQTEQPTPPGQIRITPDELRRAVAAIEGRKQEEAQRIAGTIPIGEAVSSLHLDASPEEVWSKVQVQREATARGAQPATAEAKQWAVTAEARQASQRPGSRHRPWRRVLAVGAGLWFLWGVGAIPHFGHHPRPVPHAVTASLTQIADGRVFYCDTATLVQISHGKIPPRVRMDGQRWALVKMAGHIYLRAYTVPIASLPALKGQPVVLCSDDNSGVLHRVPTAQTTLRVDGVPLQVSGGGDDYTEITVPNFQPDQLTTTSDWR